MGSFSTIGLELGLSIALGYLGGEWLDGKFGTEPWLKWIGLGFGLARGRTKPLQGRPPRPSA